MQLQEEINTNEKSDKVNSLDFIYQNMTSLRLTINFLFYRGIGMEDIECMDKLVELDNTISLLIKKIKNLQDQKPEK